MVCPRLCDHAFSWPPMAAEVRSRNQPRQTFLRDWLCENGWYLIGEEHWGPERHQLDKNRGVAFHERLHQRQEVQVHHLRQHLRVRDKLQHTRGYLKFQVCQLSIRLSLEFFPAVSIEHVARGAGKKMLHNTYATVLKGSFILHWFIIDHLSPEVEEDAGGEHLLLVLGRQKSDGLLEVDCPQLAEDEGVEERAHVHHRRLGLLREARQDHLKGTGIDNDGKIGNWQNF